MSEHEHGYVKIADIAVPAWGVFGFFAGFFARFPPGEVIAAEYICVEDGDRIYGLAVQGDAQTLRFMYQLPWGEGIPEQAAGEGYGEA